MSCVHVVFFYNLIDTTRARWQKSIIFPADVTRLSPPHVLEDRAWGRGYLQASYIIIRAILGLCFADREVQNTLHITSKR